MNSNYEYFTREVSFVSSSDNGGEVTDTITELASEGWEYYDSFSVEHYSLSVFLIFRRQKEMEFMVMSASWTTRSNDDEQLARTIANQAKEGWEHYDTVSDVHGGEVHTDFRLFFRRPKAA